MASLRRLHSVLLFSLALIAPPAWADVPQFKAGDRVEVDVNMNSDPATGKWMPGVIKQVDLGSGGYWVELDGQAGKDNWKIIPIRTDKWTRPGKALSASLRLAGLMPQGQPKAVSTPSPAARTGTEIKAHTGTHEPTVEHIKSMIVADLTFKHKLEYDHVEITFASLTVGTPYVEQAKNQTEINSLAYSRRYGVPVHPVETKFSILVRSRAGIEHFYEYDRTALWYINTRGECTLSKTGRPIDWVRVR